MSDAPFQRVLFAGSIIRRGLTHAVGRSIAARVKLGVPGGVHFGRRVHLGRRIGFGHAGIHVRGRIEIGVVLAVTAAARGKSREHGCHGELGRGLHWLSPQVVRRCKALFQANRFLLLKLPINPPEMTTFVCIASPGTNFSGSSTRTGSRFSHAPNSDSRFSKFVAKETANSKEAHTKRAPDPGRPSRLRRVLSRELICSSSRWCLTPSS